MSFFFFFNDTATTEIYTLSLHDALPIFLGRPRAAPGRAGARQDADGPDGGRGARPPVIAHPVHARPDALRHHRDGDHRAGGDDREARVPVRARARVREHRAGGRGEPYAAEDASGAAAGDAGAPGHGGGADASVARALLRAGDAEPDRAGGDVSLARGAARPLHVRAQGAGSVEGGGGGDRRGDDGGRGGDGVGGADGGGRAGVAAPGAADPGEPGAGAGGGDAGADDAGGGRRGGGGP